MKQFISLILCLFCVLSMVSCTLHPFIGTKDGEYPKHCIKARFYEGNPVLNVGETRSDIGIVVLWEGLKHVDSSIEHIDVEFSVDDPEIAEIVSYDVSELLDHDDKTGLVIKGLKPGKATITMTFIYKPTGGRSHSSTAIVTVVDPAETTE